MNHLVHEIYKKLGEVLCKALLIYWRFRDHLVRYQGTSILFVAHPDDDALFFHSYIKENHPYVVLLFTGWSTKRLIDFSKMMRYYGVRYRAYATISAEAYNNGRRRQVTENYIIECMNTGSFNIVVTHNRSGEYGHPTHKLVHELVCKVCKDFPVEILCPVEAEEIGKYPLSEPLLREKQFIFNDIYKSEAWVMTDVEAGTPIWFYNERLEKVEN